jgi:hypothetical protein
VAHIRHWRGGISARGITTDDPGASRSLSGSRLALRSGDVLRHAFTLPNHSGSAGLRSYAGTWGGAPPSR